MGEKVIDLDRAEIGVDHDLDEGFKCTVEILLVEVTVERLDSFTLDEKIGRAALFRVPQPWFIAARGDPLKVFGFGHGGLLQSIGDYITRSLNRDGIPRSFWVHEAEWPVGHSSPTCRPTFGYLSTCSLATLSYICRRPCELQDRYGYIPVGVGRYHPLALSTPLL